MAIKTESNFFISEKMVYDPLNGEYVPKWKLEECPRSYGNEYYIHYFTPKKNEYEVLAVHFHFHYGTAHLNYLSDSHPERIQDILDNGNIYLYLSRMNYKASVTVEKQVDKWKETESDFLLARKNNDFLLQAGLVENMIARAEELVFPTIVYA